MYVYSNPCFPADSRLNCFLYMSIRSLLQKGSFLCHTWTGSRISRSMPLMHFALMPYSVSTSRPLVYICFMAQNHDSDNVSKLLAIIDNPGLLALIRHGFNTL